MAGSGTAQLRDRDDLLLRAEHVVVEFPARGGRHVHAVSDVSFDVVEGETLGLVGESGCGKSTVARAVMQLPAPTGGRVVFDGHELTALRGEELRRVRPRFQLIFQDPISSLNPRRRVVDIVAEPLAIAGERDDVRFRVNQVLETVGLDTEAADRRPHLMSGGQGQRVSIARSLVQDPKLLVCDEPVSDLDVSMQAQILNLLKDMKARYGLTMLFISHDLSVVKNVSDRVAVMYLGKLCEIAPAEDLYRAPLHPYTVALLGSIPRGAGRTTPVRIPAEFPSPVDPPSGCRFRTRCPKAKERCAAEEPLMRELRPGHFVACHFPVEEPSELSE